MGGAAGHGPLPRGGRRRGPGPGPGARPGAGPRVSASVPRRVPPRPRREASPTFPLPGGRRRPPRPGGSGRGGKRPRGAPERCAGPGGARAVRLSGRLLIWLLGRGGGGARSARCRRDVAERGGRPLWAGGRGGPGRSDARQDVLVAAPLAALFIDILLRENVAK